jgi:hypothetical protein
LYGNDGVRAELQENRFANFDEVWNRLMKDRISWHPSDVFAGTDVTQFGFHNVNDWLTRDRMWAINFYNSENKSSLAIKDEYSQLAARLKDLVTIAAVDCHYEHHLCQYNNITQFPSILVFPESGGEKPSIYSNELTAAKMYDYLVDRMRHNT